MKSRNCYRRNEKSSREIKAVLIVLFLVISLASASFAARYMEKLDRGVVAVRVNASSVYVGWRMFGTDPAGISFNVYRSGVKVNAAPIITSTNYTDSTTATGTYTVRPIIGGVEQVDSDSATLWAQQYLSIPLSPPPTETMPDGTTCTYSANDCSVGDVDGDGKYEIIMKWDPSNAKDNSQLGYTGDVFLDAYKLNGTRLWRIDLGRNIRAGAHYTQFMVFDLDSDGKAEVVCKTAPGTMDSSGSYLSMGPAATDNDSTDYRSTAGYILTGPEYLTVFNGQTGREMTTVNYNPPRGTVTAWGDDYGNRVDRFLACIAYLDGVHPSVVMCRGYYTRAVLVAYDWNGTALTQRWIFDSNTAGNTAYAGQGNHNLSVGDVDGDGRDEIIYGACAIDDNGKGLYLTGLGHGDALHLGKMNPDIAGLQVFDVHESPSNASGGEYRNAATGADMWIYAATADTGRGMAGDIDPNYRGYEFWSSSTDGVYNINGTRISTTKPSVNFRIYWDGDLQDELLDGTHLDKWNGNGTTRLVSFENNGAASDNGTKANPCLTADILGDWREEVLYRNTASTQLMIFTTTTTTNYRFYTLMHDFEYRDSIAWQNVAYNQPPHVDFYPGDGPSAQPVEAIIYPGVIAPTITFTPLAGNSPSPTYTRTFTQTFTATRTTTPGFSATASFTRTNTAINTFTNSATQTSTTMLTFTLTRTPLSTATAGASATVSSVLTGTNTPVNTVTNSATQTRTSSPSSTASLTATIPVTFASTATQTERQSPTITNTAVISPTFTATNTTTPSSTRTPANTTTPSFTRTMTPSPTLTNTNTRVPSRTITITNIALPSPTLTATATIFQGDKFEITGVLVYPNPYIYPAGDLNIKIDITQPAGDIKVRIYSVSFRKILEHDFNGTDNKETVLVIPAAELNRLASGTYYVVITGRSTTGDKAVSKPQVLVILR